MVNANNCIASVLQAFHHYFKAVTSGWSYYEMGRLTTLHPNRHLSSVILAEAYH